MKHENSVGSSLLVVGAAFLFVAMKVSSQTVPPTQGGPGTIDSNTVNVNQTVRFALGQDVNKDHYAGPYATDASGDYVLGSSVGAFSGLAYVSKFSHSGTLLWRRQRIVSTVTVSDPNAPGGSRTTYYEQYSSDQTPIQISSIEGSNYAILSAITVDPAGNVFVAYDEANVNLPEYTQYSLVVKFNSAGAFQWRAATPAAVPDNGLYPSSIVRKLTANPDGSVIVAVNNFSPGGPQMYQQTVLVKFAPDGTRVTDNRFGRTTSGQKLYDSEFADFTVDSSGNIFLLTTEVAAADINPPSPAQASSVFRKLDPNGNPVQRVEVPIVRDAQTRATDSLIKIKADGSGNLYAAGAYFRPRPSFDTADRGESKQLLLKFSPQLALVWRALGPQPTQTFSDQPGSGATEISLSANGITLGGNTVSTGLRRDENDDRWEVSRFGYDDGRLIWHRLYQAPAADPSTGFSDTLNAMRADAAGNVYAAGAISVATGGVRSALIKYGDNGDLQFVKLFPDTYSGLASATLSLNAGNSRPTFYSRDELTHYDVAVIEFDNPAVVAAQGALANIATRVRVGSTDNNSLIGGFIVTGPPGTTKKILVRAIGPSLTNAGVSSALPDTTLELRDSNGKVYTNDNWRTPDPGQPGQEAEIIATTVPPTDNLESALIATVPPGNTTAIVRGKSGATGIGLVEVYDIDTASAAQVVNISTRGRVETDNDVMIGGVIVFSPNPARVIVRALGPSLANAGLQNALQDPQLELYDGNGRLIVSNDDWKVRDSSQTSQQAEIEETTIPPTDPGESALRATLDPGNYTALVRGKDRTTGLALVEVYRLR
jgi:hypothetical protein